MPKDISQPLSSADLQPSNASLLKANSDLQKQVGELERQIAWFQKQIFGSKSERRHVDDNPQQIPLLGLATESSQRAPETKATVTYERGTAKKQRLDDCVNDAGLRFNADVPVEIISLPAPELHGPDADQYEIISGVFQASCHHFLFKLHFLPTTDFGFQGSVSQALLARNSLHPLTTCLG
jgi:hypothetical protein